MTQFVEKLRENYLTVENRIQKACERAGRERSDVTLVAVTKYAKWEWVEALFELGHRDFGENRPQQLIERATRMSSLARWHLIGHLQSNKAKSVVTTPPPGCCESLLIHSVDSLKLLELLNRLAADLKSRYMPKNKEDFHHLDELMEQLASRPRLLLEVNVTGEATKDGFTPDELRGDWEAVVSCQQVEIRGFMTMAMASEDPETARQAFRALRELRDELRARVPADAIDLSDLSMGMTGDFEVAIEEGATFVRIGSALFEGLE